MTAITFPQAAPAALPGRGRTGAPSTAGREVFRLPGDAPAPTAIPGSAPSLDAAPAVAPGAAAATLPVEQGRATGGTASAPDPGGEAAASLDLPDTGAAPGPSPATSEIAPQVPVVGSLPKEADGAAPGAAGDVAASATGAPPLPSRPVRPAPKAASSPVAARTAPGAAAQTAGGGTSPAARCPAGSSEPAATRPAAEGEPGLQKGKNRSGQGEDAADLATKAQFPTAAVILPPAPAVPPPPDGSGPQPGLAGIVTASAAASGRAASPASNSRSLSSVAPAAGSASDLQAASSTPVAGTAGLQDEKAAAASPPPGQHASRETDGAGPTASADLAPAILPTSARATDTVAAIVQAAAEPGAAGGPAAAALGAASALGLPAVAGNGPGVATTTASSSPNPATDGVAIANVPVEIGMRSLAGTNRFEIRLSPEDLGRVDVRLDIAEGGQVRAHLTVERPETLAFLQRDSGHLERALEQAGFRPQEGGGVALSLRDPGGDAAAGRQAQNDGGGGGGGQPRPQAGGRGSDQGGGEAGAVPTTRHVGWTRASGIDLRI